MDGGNKGDTIKGRGGKGASPFHPQYVLKKWMKDKLVGCDL